MATGVIRQNKRRFENLFFSGMAVLILATADGYGAIKARSEWVMRRSNSKKL